MHVGASGLIYSFFNLLLLAMLIYTFVLTYMDHKCVFGTKCCPTDLENDSSTKGPATVYLKQVLGKNAVASELFNDESTTFNFTKASGSSFFRVNINYTADVTSVSGEVWPSEVGSSSGFSIFKSGDYDGVSIYLKYYYQQLINSNLSEWNHSYKVVNYGISTLLDNKVNFGESKGYYVNIIPAKEGFEYFTGWFSKDGGNTTVEADTNLGTSESYFSNFKNNSPNLTLNYNETEAHTYNPMLDYYRAKTNESSPEYSCSTNPANCSCIDPSAKSLPSCHAPRFPGKGYAYTDNNGDTKYSKNCNSAMKVAIVEEGQDYGNIQYAEQVIPHETIIGDALASTKTDSNTVKLKNSIKNNTKVGNDPVKNKPGYAGKDEYYNLAYTSGQLFCGSGSVTAISTVYPEEGPGDDLTATNQNIGLCFQETQIPNAELAPNGKNYILGFK